MEKNNSTSRMNCSNDVDFEDQDDDDNDARGQSENEAGQEGLGAMEEDEEQMPPQMEINQSDDNENEEDEFAEIPVLPTGQQLRFELLSPWDDPQFVGLGGIELFTEEGIRPPIASVWTNALESTGDLRALVEGTGHGERRQWVEGVDSGGAEQMWLCNYRQIPSDSVMEPIHISIQFEEPQTLAMIRIWNYAGSRVHALRGVRNLRLWLDQQCIFRGEICCAFAIGQLGETPQGDTILFTTNEEILSKIAEHDDQMQMMSIAATAIDGAKPLEQLANNDVGEGKLLIRPDQQLALLACAGGGGGGGGSESETESTLSRVSAPNRPTTGHTTNSSSSRSGSCSAPSTPTGPGMAEGRGKEAEKGTGTEAKEEEELEENLCIGKLFHIELLANWGSPDSIGLAGIQFLGPHFEPLLEECVVRCEPAAENLGGPQSFPQNLINGRNLSCRPEDMWLTRWEQPQQGIPPPMLSFTFPHEVRLSGVSIWNYNASPELSYAGVRCARFYANGRPINGIGTVLLRKAPGFVFFDFVQDVLFDRCPLLRPLTNSRPQTRSVAAFIFQLRLLSSWGDDFYIGLNGIELFNRRDQRIHLRPQNLAAFPESVNCLAQVHGNDPRSSDKLIDGVNDTQRTHHMWLTPILPNSFARVFLIFDAPTIVSRIRIYNYRKTPERGVRHIALSADDLLLCSGAEVPMSTPEATGILDIPLREDSE